MREVRTGQADLSREIGVALAELKETIGTLWPGTLFEVFQGDDPDGTYLRATVDVEDPDVVLDAVSSRLLSIQVEDGLPVYVVPVRPLARVLEEQRLLGLAQPRPVRKAAATI